MPRNAILAVRITEQSLDMIERINGGVRPEIEAEPTYFVLERTDTPDETACIYGELDFRSRYALMHLPIQDDAFVHVKKITTS